MYRWAITTISTEAIMGAAAVAAVIARKEREIVEAYRNVQAISPAAARDPSDLGVDQRAAFTLLVRRAVLRHAGDGRYYLDEPSWEAMRGVRRQMLVVVLIIAIIVLVSLLLMGGAAALGHVRTT